MKLREIKKRFEEKKMKYEILCIGNGAELLVSQQGGRIFGSYFSEDDEGLFLVSNILKRCKKLSEF